LVDKYIQFNGFTSSGPGDNFGSVASGASDDWFYATLGAAGVTFELGNAFHQDCPYFESSILPGNLKALTYAAKVSSKPYSLPKGPDIENMIVTPEQVVGNLPDAFVRVTFDVTTNANANLGASPVAVVRIYVDVHPYEDTDTITGPLLTLTGSQLQVADGVSSSDGRQTTLGVGTIVLDQLADTSPGRHAVYAEAVDSNGNVGPVTATWFAIILASPSPAPTLFPTARPTETPTAVPTPEQPKPLLPTTIPTEFPTPRPTPSPLPRPTQAPGPDAVTPFPTRTPTTSPTGKPIIVPTGLLASKFRLVPLVYRLLFLFVDSHTRLLFLPPFIRSILQLARVAHG
jgi:hypothetical protein